MYDETKTGLNEAQEQAVQAAQTIRTTNRSALRSYLRAAFDFQRAGLEALDALQRGAEELTFGLVDRAENVSDRATSTAEERLRESIDRLQAARERVQGRLEEQAGELEENGEQTTGRLRDGAEIAMKVAKVLETRIETMVTELIEMGRREIGEIEERVDALVDRLDAELEEEIHPIADYDQKTVEEITSELDSLDEMQLRTVRAYEVTNKNRVTLLRAIDEQLADLEQMTV